MVIFNFRLRNMRMFVRLLEISVLLTGIQNRIENIPEQNRREYTRIEQRIYQNRIEESIPEQNREYTRRESTRIEWRIYQNRMENIPEQNGKYTRIEWKIYQNRKDNIPEQNRREYTSM